MKWIIDLFSGLLGKKLIMALTGIFLITFLVVHLAGNLQLLKGDGGKSFNIYADFMSTNPFIQFVSKVNFILIVTHAVWAVLLTLKNSSSRGKGYANTNKSSPWASRNMGILGTLILLFIVVHLRHFYAEMHWGEVPAVHYGDAEVRDIYRVVDYWFAKAWYVGLYIACMGALAFHLWHGVESAFQTLGANHAKYTPLIATVGKTFAIVVPGLYAAIPTIMFFNHQ